MAMSTVLQRIPGWFGGDLGIDLGTTNTVVYVRGRGIVSAEPSVIALDRRTQAVLAIGNAAQAMIEKTPPDIMAMRPVQGGVVADFRSAERILAHVIRQATGPRPRVVVSVPSGVTDTERHAARIAAEHVGARRAFLIEEPLAAAIGAGLPIAESIGSMIVDIGGGTTEVAIIALGGLIVTHTSRAAGDMIDEAIVQFAQRRYDLLISTRMAERAKLAAGSAYPLDNELTVVLRGRHTVTGLPKAVEVSSVELRAGIAAPVGQIVGLVRAALDETPPELIADIMDLGITLVGGGSLMHGIVQRLEVETKISVRLADDPLGCVARGAGLMVEGLSNPQYRRVLEHTQRDRRSRLVKRFGWSKN